MTSVTPELTLWGVGTSRTMRPHWMLLEMGLEYQCVPIGSRTGQTTAPEFLSLNPRHKIPVLRHGRFVLTESAAILEYLGEAFEPPAGFWVPKHPAGRARLHEWNHFVVSELDACALYVIRRHLGLKHVYGEAPQAVQSARDYFVENLEAMAPRIAKQRYLLDEGFSMADILLMTCLDWALAEGIALSQSIHRYRQRVALRPSYAAALKSNFPATTGKIGA